MTQRDMFGAAACPGHRHFVTRDFNGTVEWAELLTADLTCPVCGVLMRAVPRMMTVDDGDGDNASGHHTYQIPHHVVPEAQ